MRIKHLIVSKNIACLLLLSVLLLPLSLWPSDNRSDDRQAQERSDQNEFVVVYSPKKLILDPLHIYTTMESELCTAIYEGLLSYHPFTLEPIPGVASRWDVNNNGKVYRFYLREDALYSNGDPIRAADFRDSWLRILNPEAKAEYSFLFDIIRGAKAFRKGVEGDEIGIRVISDKILEVELEKPATHFLKLLCHLSFVPVHHSYLNAENWDSSASIIGNGPFYITERSDRELVLSKNNLYWDTQNVEMDIIRVLFIEDAAEISEMFNQGTIDWANIWESSLLKNREKIVFNPMFATSYFYFVCTHPPWNDERVRLALTLLLPMEEIRGNQLLFATARLIPPIPSYPKVEGIVKTDSNKAFSLLKEAGFPEGRGLPLLLIKVAQDSGSEQIAQTMAETWKKMLNLQVSILTYPYNQYLKEVKKTDYVIGSVTWIGDYADPLTFLQMWTESSNLNDARFDDPEFDLLIDTSLGEQGVTRYNTLGKAEEILLSKAVVLPINHTPAFNLIDLDRIEGWFPNVLNIHPFKYFRFRSLRLPPGVVHARY